MIMTHRQFSTVHS